MDEALKSRGRNNPILERVWRELDPLGLLNVELLVERVECFVESLFLLFFKVTNVERLRREDGVLVAAIVEFEANPDIARHDWVTHHGWIDSREEQDGCQNEHDDSEGEAEADEELLSPVSLLKLAPLLPLIALILVVVDIVEGVV